MSGIVSDNIDRQSGVIAEPAGGPEVRSDDPSASAGTVWFNTTSGVLKVYRLITGWSTGNAMLTAVKQQGGAGTISAGAILHYLKETHHHLTQHISSISRIEREKYVWMDRFTIRNLELFSSPNENAKTLIEVLDYTKSAMGSRMIKRWLALPLKEGKEINNRTNIVSYLIKNEEFSCNYSW